MPRPTCIEAYAIVSDDGMLADANRRIPDAMKIDADQKFFQAGLDRAAVVVQGRHSYEGGPHAPDRFRLVMTRRIEALAPDAARAKSLLWNPNGATLDTAWERLGAPDGVLAVIGGPEVYDHFLGVGYDIFHLSRAAGVLSPGGRPVFTEIGPTRTPEDVLASHGLKPGPRQVLDVARGATLVTWAR
jgi:dihydrofolate reductase